MNTTLKNSFKIGLVAIVLFFSTTVINKTVSFQNTTSNEVVAKVVPAPLFGNDEFKYEPQKVETAEDITASKVKWSLLVFAILLILVLANAFDISALTSKITGIEAIDGNSINKWIMLIFMIVGLIAVGWEYKVHGDLILLGNASSEHGESYDSMFRITLILTTIVFVVTQFLLFYFPFIYARKENHKALYYSHNNKLELFWTIIPAIVLTILVLRGHQTWRNIVYADENMKSIKIEVFAEQFAWTARYAGEDGILGEKDYKFISGKNKLGLAYLPEVDSLLVELKGKIAQDEKAINDLPQTLVSLNSDLQAAKDLQDYTAIESIETQIEQINTGETLDELEASIKRKIKQVERITFIKNDKALFASTFTSASEDDILTQEIHLALGEPVTFLFRSRDIIHSAWLPHFRVQMNVVPGMPTKFTFIPSKTTAEAKNENGKDFEYYLFCNKICGSSHYNMKMKVVVETKAELEDLMKKQKPAFKDLPVVLSAPAVMKSDSTKISKDTTKIAIKKMAMR